MDSSQCLHYSFTALSTFFLSDGSCSPCAGLVVVLVSSKTSCSFTAQQILRLLLAVLL